MMDQGHWLDPLLHEVLLALAAVLAGMVIEVVRRVLTKLGLELDARNQAKLDYLVRTAILEAEERVEAAVKKQTLVIANKSARKLEIAMATVLGKVPGISPKEAEALIKAKLPESGLGAAGARFLGAVVQAATTSGA